MNNQFEVLIVGAGLSGLMAAQTCKEQGISYIVLDKGRSVGGRMATRRIAGGKADHGAQFFTARSETMKTLVQNWKEKDLINVWSNGFHQMEGKSIAVEHDGYPRYVGTNGMNALMKDIAKDLHTVVGQKVEKISEIDGRWKVTAIDTSCSEEVTYKANKLILTAPVPQSQQLLEAGGVKLEKKVIKELNDVSYYPCLCAIVALDKRTTIPSPGGIQVGEGMLAFIGDNEQKGISESTVVTIHGSEQWSKYNYERDSEEILDELIEAVKPLLGEGEIIEKRQLMRWLYSKPEILHPEEYLGTVTPAPVVFTGDIFKRGKVEGAILSGLSGVNWILKQH
ncbi:NAD(P)/FAD-dependent oxidoreductase [Bacillus sp. FJAT-45350]|uniref:NAD(P)/FAD-dependent oxidoreductase n=1 Tax=Bacillus sp. FJAT-45350 TaxID=2011014 RepID=UPI000BB81661|nr:FAD-dependent oxidoreductase [Bacillus sp. FJAT-45350]